MRIAPLGKNALAIFCLSILLCTIGCRYTANRAADLTDIFQLGAGIVTEDTHGGPWPPALGIHAQVTEFINLGAIHTHGYAAEWEGRGFFAGPETRTRLGLGPLQAIHLDQNYRVGLENYYKKANGGWAKRMRSPKRRWWNAPAKQLEWSLYKDTTRYGIPVMHRGFQYWENIGLEIALSEPFLTHLGFTLRAGFDPSEIADFALGLFCIDFKRDDLTRKELRQMLIEDFGCPETMPEHPGSGAKARKSSKKPFPKSKSKPQ